MGKTQHSRSGDEETAVSTKWPYYKQLVFLKDVVKARAPTRKVRSRLPSLSHSSVGVEEDADTEGSQSTRDSPLPTDQEESIEMDPTEIPRSKNVIKRAKKTLNDKMLDEHKPRFVQDKEKDRLAGDDEHLLFFKSLLPHVNKIPQHMLLSFRNRVQDVVNEFAYPSQKEAMPNYTKSESPRHGTPVIILQNESTFVQQTSGDDASATSPSPGQDIFK